MIVENGVTYNVYADRAGARPALDPRSAAALSDRGGMAAASRRASRSARGCLNAVLADLYGTQRAARRRARCPPRCRSAIRIFSGRARHRARRGDRWLHIYAADLARSRRRALVGARRPHPGAVRARAMRSRIAQIVRRVLPELRQDIGRAAAGRDFSPRCARSCCAMPATSSRSRWCSRPGSFNETYFEHAYLARQLGLPWSRATISPCATTRVYLKTLAGLRRVHAILRRLDDDFCDPVELRADSALGVPGLLGAVRAGNVVRRQRARQRRAGIRGVARISARDRRAAARRDAELALGGDLVVRRASRPSSP